MYDIDKPVNVVIYGQNIVIVVKCVVKCYIKVPHREVCWPGVPISDHPKGYLTKITNDYAAQYDEELTVQKGTMVKVIIPQFIRP